MNTITVDHGNIHQIKRIEIKKNSSSEGHTKYITLKFYETTSQEIQIEHELCLFHDKSLDPDINLLLGDS